MSNPMPQIVLVVLTGGIIPAGLGRAAVRNGWPVYNAAPELPAITRAGARVLMVHVPEAHEAGLEVVRSLRTRWNSAVVVVLGAAGGPDEVFARSAGASLFLPESSDAGLIENTVWSLTVPARAGRSARAAG